MTLGTADRRTTRLRSALIALLGAVGLLGGFLAVTAPAASAVSAAVRTCFGKPATIVDLRESADVRGTPGPDVIVVRADARVFGLGGNDRICGHGDLWGGRGDDLISMRGHPNGELDFVVAHGGEGDDEIHRDEPLSDDPHFSIETYGGPGNDKLIGGPNFDLLAGGPGNDFVWGGRLASDLRGGYGADRLVGGPSHDALNGGPGPDVLRGGARQDRLNGAEGDDLILGGDDDDRAKGSLGDDRILGQKGVDWADGGPGDDVCHAETVRDCRP
jgi:Ca2+-binding RTX toxin-like protein